MKLYIQGLMVFTLSVGAIAAQARPERNAGHAAQLALKNSSTIMQEPQRAVTHHAQGTSATTAQLMEGVARHPASRQTYSVTRAVIEQCFLAADYNETGQYSPNAEGAVGTEQFLLAVNGRVRSFNKKTGQPDGMLNLSLDRFFSPILSEGYTSDAGCVYDSFEKRWYVVCDWNGASVPSTGLMLAISDNGPDGGDRITPETVWHYVLVDQADNPYFEFAPVLANFGSATIGFDTNNIYVAANIYQSLLSNGASIPYISSVAYVIAKEPALNGGTPIVHAFRNLLNQNTFTGPIYLWPAINYDTDPQYAFFVGANALDYFDGDSTHFLLSIVDLATMTIDRSVTVTVDEYVTPINVQPLGTPISRIISPGLGFAPLESHIRTGTLFFSNCIGMDASGESTASTVVDRDGARIYAVDVSSPYAPSLLYTGSLFDNTSTQMSYITPSFMTNELGQAVIGATQCGPTAYLNAVVAAVDAGVPQKIINYTEGNFSYYPAEDANLGFVDGAVITQAGWGQHSRMSLDPIDGGFWACQQWCSDTNIWGLQVAHVRPVVVVIEN